MLAKCLNNHGYCTYWQECYVNFIVSLFHNWKCKKSDKVRKLYSIYEINDCKHQILLFTNAPSAKLFVHMVVM